MSGEPLRGFDRAMREYEAREPDERLERRDYDGDECAEDFSCRCAACVAEDGDEEKAP